VSAAPQASPGPERADTRGGFWSEVWRRFRKDRQGMVGLTLVVVFFLVAFTAPFLANDKPVLYRSPEGRWSLPALKEPAGMRNRDWSLPLPQGSWAAHAPVPYSPESATLTDRLLAPSAQHLMGTDNLGRDVLARMIHGAGVSLQVGFVAMGIAALIGVFVGLTAGYFGGRYDLVMSRLIEIVMCFPTFFLILTIIAIFPPSIYNIMVVIGITRWPGIARYVRGEVLRLKALDFTVAARALGASHARVIVRHILPNALAPVLVTISFGIAGSILTESALSFLGFGVPPPAPTWGNILALARTNISVAPWLATFPGIAIFLTVTAYNLVGEALRDAADPRAHGR